MKTKDTRFLVIVIIILVLVIIGIIVKGESMNKKIDYSELTDEEIVSVVDEMIDEREDIVLASYGERDRIEIYIKSFFSAIETEDYEKAYEMLYPEFRNNYYPTLESFTTFINENISKHVSISYNNFERNGNYYYSWLTIKSLSSLANGNGKDFIFVVRENDLNDFELSFSVR